MKNLILFLTVCLAMIWSPEAHGTHLMGADLTYTIIGPHQYKVSLSVYRDCNGIAMPSSYTICWSSATCNDTGSFVVNVAAGYPTNVTDTCLSEHSTCDGGTVYGVQNWVYTANVNLPAGCPDVVLSWASGDRNVVISNLTNPGNDPMYISAEVNTSLIMSSPQFLNPLTANLCLDQMNYINQAGHDANGDSLVYALAPAQGNTGGLGAYPYIPYNLNYSGGYSPTHPITSSYFNFDPTTGQITVFPTQSEYDVVKIIVYAYRNGVQVGYVERDMQIEVNNCTDTLPNLSGVGGSGSTDSVYTLSACATGCFSIASSTSNSIKVLTLSLTGQASFPGATFTISSGRTPTLTFCWTPTRADAGTFSFTVTVKDNACPQPGQNTKSYKVIVPEVYPAGPDQTICQYSTVTTQATGTGTWAAMSTNPVTTTIANTASPTTLISGFTATGRYNYIWTSATICIDTMSIFVSSKPNAGPDQTTCQNSPATMAATGGGTWTALSTNPATTTIATPASPTSVISGFTAAGTYTYLWTSGGCADTADVIVLPRGSGGPNQSTCLNSTVTMAAAGTGTWTASGADPVVTTITSATSPTTTITGFIAAGTYTYYWASSSCGNDTVLITVNAKPNAGPDQSTCQYSTATMAATGAGAWTASAGNPAVVTFTNSSSPVTSVSGLTAAGTYTVFWSNGGCNDTALINVTAKPNAGPDQTTCQYSTATMAATGTGTWTAVSTNPATTIITTPASPTTVISGFTVAGPYGYIWTENGCSDTANVIVNAKPIAGPGQITCQYSTATMAATGAGTWSGLSANPATTVITTPTSPTTVISGFTVAGTYSYIWTENVCTDTTNVTVTAKPNAGPDQTTCQYSTATMSATGLGTWTTLSANPAATVITTATSPTTVISGFTVAGPYGYIWTENGCSDTANVIVTAKPNSGPGQTTCQYSTATMAATGAGTWSALPTNPATTVITAPTSPATVISGFTVPGTYSYVWTVNGCTDTSNVTVTVKPNAGPDQTTCQYSTATMAGTGLGTWTALPTNPAATVITTTTSPTTVISGFTVAGTYGYIWTANGCTDTANVIVTAKPNSGPGQTTCQYSTATMAATGAGTWSALPTNPAATIITTPTSPATVISGFTIAGTYSYIWTVNGCADTTNVTVIAKPNAGPDQTICRFTTATMAATGAGTWTALPTNPATTVITTPASPASSISGFSVAGTYSYIWTENGCTDTANVIVIDKPNGGPNQTLCQYSTATMAAVGVGAWSALATNPVATVIDTPSSATTVISGFSLSGVYSYVWTSGGCTDTMTVTVTAKPNAGPDVSFCMPGSITINAVSGPGVWTAMSSNPGGSTIVSPANTSSVVSGITVGGYYHYIWTVNGCTDTTMVTAYPSGSAGPDQTACQYAPIITGAFGNGTWVPLSTNPATTVITNSTADTTAITGFNVPGLYGYIWSVGPCNDTLYVTVVAKPNAGSDQTICQYSITTLTATGTGTWTAALSNPTVVTFANTTLATTQVSGFTASGTYTLYWSLNGCSDTVLINVTPKPNAGIDQTICQYSTTALAATGTGTWTADAGNPAVVTFTNPTDSISPVSGFTVAGAYTLYWSLNGCSDTVLINVTPKPNAGPDQTVSCAILPGGVATMAATGTGAWTAQIGNPGAATITAPTSSGTTITGFSTAGAYDFLWTAGGCADTAAVVVSAKPNAGPDQTICQYNPITTAAIGSGLWTILSGNPNPTVIANALSGTTTINGFNIAGTYGYIWTVSGCTDTLYVTVVAKPNAGTDQTICQYSTTALTATGTGTWTADAGNPAIVNFVNATLSTTQVSGFTTSGTYTLYWSLNGCSDTVLINVTAKPYAGIDQTICQYSVTALAATGTGTWTADAGNPAVVFFVNTISPATSVSGFTASGTYTLYWSLNGCSDTVLINVTPKPNAGADQSLCLPGTITTAASAGPGLWTALTSNPAGSIIATPASSSTVVSGFTTGGIYSYVWTVNGCPDTMNASIIPLSPAGPDQTICQYNSITTAAFGNGLWTILSSNPNPTVIANALSGTTTINGFNIAGTYGYIWTVNGCTDTMFVTVVAKPNAGADQTICQYSTTALAASNTGTWTAAAGNPSLVVFANPTSPATQVSGFTAPGTYTLYWSLNGCSDTVLINVTPKPNAGTDQTICQYSTTALAATGTGAWTADAGNPAVVVFVNTTSPTTFVSGFTASGTYTLYWSLNGCSDTVLINVTPKPNAGIDQTICQYSSTAMAATGAGTWTAAPGNPAVVVFANPTDSISPVSGFTNSGIYTLYWSLNGCSDTVLIHVTAKPNAGTDQTICQYSSTVLAATGAGIWTAAPGNPTVVVFANPTDSISPVSGFTNSGIYTLYWSLNGCSDTMLIHVTAKPNAGPGQNICQFTTATMAAIGAGTWTLLPANPSVASITNPTAAGTTITGLDSVGTYSFIWTVNGCADTVSILVSPQPTLSLRDTAICRGMSAALVPVASPAGGTYLWSTTAITPTITVSPAVTTGYTLTYTLGICATTIRDTVIINPLPIAIVSTIASVCTAHDGMAIAHPGAGTPGYTYSWSAPGGTGDTLSNLPPNTYQVTVTDINHCTVTASGTIAHQTPAIIVNEVSQHNLKCFNDGTGDIYISTADTAGATGTHTMTYIWSGGAGTAQDLTNVQAGGYSVTVTDQFGCTGAASYTLTQPQAITASTAVTDPHCFGYNDGTASVTPSGGSGAYHYTWSTTPAQHSQQAINLAAGIYTVSVTDDSACLATFIDTLINPLAITFGNAIIRNSSCLGVSNGMVTAVPQNGIGNYTFRWSNGQTGNPDTALAPGVYIVTATDANGCFASDTVTVLPQTQVAVSITPTNVTCFGLADASATANPSGGIPPYSYLWNTNAKTGTISGLTIGTYTVTASDVNGCSASNATTITQPPLLVQRLASVRTNCPFSQDGSIIDTAAGGTGTVTYTLKNAANTVIQTNTTGTFTGLGYGLYVVVAADQNNCQSIDTISVPQAPFNYYTDSAISTSCYGSQYTDGIIHLQGYTIPNGPFQYSLDSGTYQYTPDFYHLSAGRHTITVQDHYGCDTTFTITVPEALPATLQILPGDSTIAPGASLQLSTVFSPYGAGSIKTYSWTPGNGLSCIDCPSPAVSPYADQTLYTLVVTYNEGCIDTAFIQINTHGTPPVYIPNAFTPNGDGVNDVWYVFGTGIKDIKVTVFNRWGEKVFESDDQSIGWDGTYRGQAQPPGVYVYAVYLVYLNGDTKSKSGSLSLIR
jgi:gliding motility-associated-like protein